MKVNKTHSGEILKSRLRNILAYMLPVVTVMFVSRWPSFISVIMKVITLFFPF